MEYTELYELPGSARIDFVQRLHKLRAEARRIRREEMLAKKAEAAE